MICRNCGNDMGEGASVCPKCGVSQTEDEQAQQAADSPAVASVDSAVSENAAVSAEAASETQEAKSVLDLKPDKEVKQDAEVKTDKKPTKGSKKKVFIIVGAVALVAICLVVCLFLFRPNGNERRVIKLSGRVEERELGMDDYPFDENSDDDSDYDGLTNKQEKEKGTNPRFADSDFDNLNDSYELSTSKTDPNKKDTDDDGLNDYDEIELGLDPLNADSKGDGIKDGQRELSYNYEYENVNLTINGSGNIASTIVDVNSNMKISGKKGLIDNLYSLHTDGTLKEAVLTIKYTDEELKKYGVNEDNLSIYYYNDKESKYEKIDSVVDKANKTVSATLKHFSYYVVGDLYTGSKNEILFVLDNSWSMYTNEQYTKYTGKEYPDSDPLDGFDSAGLRFDLTKKLASKIAAKNGDDIYDIGLSEFRKDYKNANKIGSSADEINKTLSSMMGQFITSKEGTDIGNAIMNGFNEFEKYSDNKYLIILTDGLDSSLSRNTQKIVREALENRVKICVVGFGGATNSTELSSIANSTGCKFYSSTDASGLSELFDSIGTELNDGLVDIDNDGTNDGIVLADSGFIVSRDGFSFKNYASNLTKGHCYGMATFAELYYTKKLPLSYPMKTVSGKTAYSYTIKNDYLKKYNSLYGYRLKSNVLKHFEDVGFDYFGEEYGVEWMQDGDKLTFSDEYRAEIKSDAGNLYDFGFTKTRLSAEQQIQKHGFNYSKYEYTILNVDDMQTNGKMDSDDVNLFNAIYTAFLKQDRDEHYSSGDDFYQFFRDTFGIDDIVYMGKNVFINILKTRLRSGDVPVMGSIYNERERYHAVNAISLVQDLNDSNHYYIGVYDNNYPGKKRYVDIECGKSYCYTKANDYYTSNKEPIRITGSLEYDLDYYSEN